MSAKAKLVTPSPVRQCSSWPHRRSCLTTDQISHRKRFPHRKSASEKKNGAKAQLLRIRSCPDIRECLFCPKFTH